MMKILVLGADGYLGFTVARYLTDRGHDVVGIDSYAKRVWMEETNTRPLFGNEKLTGRAPRAGFNAFAADVEDGHHWWQDNEDCDAIIHFAEQPSAPYSMMGDRQAETTILNNVMSTLEIINRVKADNPNCHIVKLGTMGEYGTPYLPIPEGWIELDHEDTGHVMERMLFPKRPGSLYHTSKVMDSDMLEFACRVWQLRVTDLHQGVVYGVPSDCPNDMLPKFYYDHIWGTALNRFLVQAAVGHPLTVYGKGLQKRTFLHIDDTCQCIELALNNPPDNGEYRVRNQFTEIFSIEQIASAVAAIDGSKIDYINNPRVEDAEHYYRPSNQSFLDLGLNPKMLNRAELKRLFELVEGHKNNVIEESILPTVRWRK